MTLSALYDFQRNSITLYTLTAVAVNIVVAAAINKQMIGRTCHSEFPDNICSSSAKMCRCVLPKAENIKFGVASRKVVIRAANQQLSLAEAKAELAKRLHMYSLKGNSLHCSRKNTVQHLVKSTRYCWYCRGAKFQKNAGIG
jgi:hypothetical protein